MPKFIAVVSLLTAAFSIIMSVSIGAKSESEIRMLRIQVEELSQASIENSEAIKTNSENLKGLAGTVKVDSDMLEQVVDAQVNTTRSIGSIQRFQDNILALEERRRQ